MKTDKQTISVKIHGVNVIFTIGEALKLSRTLGDGAVKKALAILKQSKS